MAPAALLLAGLAALAGRKPQLQQQHLQTPSIRVACHSCRLPNCCVRYNQQHLLLQQHAGSIWRSLRASSTRTRSLTIISKSTAEHQPHQALLLCDA